MKVVALLIICLVGFVRSTPINAPDRRQISYNPKPSPSPSSSGDENKHYTSNVPLTVIVTISLLLALALGVVLYVRLSSLSTKI